MTGGFSSFNMRVLKRLFDNSPEAERGEVQEKLVEIFTSCPTFSPKMLRTIAVAYRPDLDIRAAAKLYLTNLVKNRSQVEIALLPARGA